MANMCYSCLRRFRTLDFLKLFLDENQSGDWLKTHGDHTLVSNVLSSPLPSPKAAGTKGREIKQVHAKLKLIEEVNILEDDTAGKRSTVSA